MPDFCQAAHHNQACDIKADFVTAAFSTVFVAIFATTFTTHTVTRMARPYIRPDSH
jgi:hypothetical protein